MEYENRQVNYTEDTIIMTHEEYEKLQRIFKSSITSKYPSLKEFGIPSIDRIVLIGGLYRNEYAVDINKKE